jgi:serine protease Do
MTQVRSAFFASFALGAGLLIGTLANTSVHAAKPDQATPLEIPKPTELSNTFSGLAKRLEPSVVKITSTVGGRVRRTAEDVDPDSDDALRRFFGGNLPQQRRSMHMGSGVIVDPNGYIITNHHVIDGASRIQVKLTGDPTEYEAKLVGSDQETDLAVIRVDVGHKLAPAKIGNSDAVQVGEWVVAIGAPFGFETSVTAGIISAKGRDLGDREHPLPRFLQTDAAINQGNSGGPLLNVRGEIIGINSAIETRSGGFEGIGFAIPINKVAKVYNDIIRDGKVSRGAIGISFNSRAKPELLKAYGADAGVFVEQVTPGGPAEKAGMKAGDVITGFQGQPVKSGDDLLGRVQELRVGTKCDVTVLRDGKRVPLKLEITDRAELTAASTGSRPPERRQNDQEKGPASEATPVRFGFSVQELTSEDKKELNFPGKTGILITKVDPGSFAEDIGLREGDVITHMNRQALQLIADLKGLQSNLKPGDAVAFRVLRNLSQGGAEWQPFFAAGAVPNR